MYFFCASCLCVSSVLPVQIPLSPLLFLPGSSPPPTLRSLPGDVEITTAPSLWQDLLADLKSELSGSLAKVILALMMTPAQYDAKQLKKAMEVGTKPALQGTTEVSN